MHRRMTERSRGKIASLRHKGGLRLTSMMDILTVLLLFLLKSFVVEGAAVTPPAGLDLPESSAERKPEETVVIAIFDGTVLVGEEPVITVAEALSSEELFIETLGAHLDSMADQMDEISRLRGTDVETVRKATIQGDQRIEFQILERVMFTLSESGFEDISLAVLQTS